jgi:hypothetical protein
MCHDNEPAAHAAVPKRQDQMLVLASVLACACACAADWRHPAGLVSEQTITEIRDKIASQPWAAHLIDSQKKGAVKWLDAPPEKLREVFPTTCGNVYHNFSCPDDRTRLQFDPFNPRSFHCNTCGRDFAPDTDAGIYQPGDRYHGTMYDGWKCLFFQAASSTAANLALIGRVDQDEALQKKAAELLLLFADTIRGIPTDRKGEGQYSRILTYHREGDSAVLYELATAYELARGVMSADERARVEKDVLTRMLEDEMLEPIYTYNHNNLYQWYRAILQTAVALEREDLVDWACGYGNFTPEKQPEHHSLRKLIAEHFKPDGTYWELCSGYHLYPLNAFCEDAVLLRHLSQMDPARFPAKDYDLTSPENAGAKVIKNALEWFVSMAMPDRDMVTVGDSMAPWAGMEAYASTAEVGYRYFDVRAVGDYTSLRQGNRSWSGLLYGAPEIKQQPTPFTSSFLSSGWVSLRNEWEGNRVWVGLNALLPGGGHQHADRLTLTLFSQGKLLALEKATPYNEPVTRELGTMSQSHNTVTVDLTSQKQGESLKGDEVPEVKCFFSGKFAQFAELRGDNLYPKAKVYRRSVAVIEDIVIDCFQVEGGSFHDWIVNHTGPAPELLVRTEPAGDFRPDKCLNCGRGETSAPAHGFSPEEWLYGGSGKASIALTLSDWEARWHVDGVTSRLTMLGGAKTTVFALETYPIDNAVITPGHPPCQTLCARRTNNAPYLAVWDAFRTEPNLQSVYLRGPEPEEPGPRGLVLKTKNNTYHVKFGDGDVAFADGMSLAGDAAFSIARNNNAVAFAGGTKLSFTTPAETLSASLNEFGGAEADWSETPPAINKARGIQYDTYGSEAHVRNAASITIAISKGNR